MPFKIKRVIDIWVNYFCIITPTVWQIKIGTVKRANIRRILTGIEHVGFDLIESTDTFEKNKNFKHSSVEITWCLSLRRIYFHNKYYLRSGTSPSRPKIYYYNVDEGRSRLRSDAVSELTDSSRTLIKEC